MNGTFWFTKAGKMSSVSERATKNTSFFHMESDTTLAEKIVPATWMPTFKVIISKKKKSKGTKIEKK